MNLLGFGYGNLIRNAIDLRLVDGVAKHLVAIFDTDIFDVECIGSHWSFKILTIGVYRWKSSVVVFAHAILIDVDAIVLDVAEIDCVDGCVFDQLSYSLGAAA